MADRAGLARAQPTTDLFWTPLFLQQAIDAVPRFRRNAPFGFGVPARQRQAVGLLRPIATETLILPHFATDGGGVNPDDTGYLRVPVSGFQEDLDLIAMIQAQLCVVSQQRSSNWSVKEARRSYRN